MIKFQRKTSRTRIGGLSCACLLAAGAHLMTPMEVHAQRIFSEDFEGLTLGPKVDEGLAGSAVWTEMGPAGWVLDDSKMPGVGIPTQDGVTEWSGWSFANKNWWAQTAGGQQREQFSLGSGTVMIADNDEWDDAAHAQGFWDATIKTKAISLAGVPANSLVLFYDSSWRPEATDDGLPNFPVDAEGNRINDQTGYIWAQFDANTNEVQRWTSIGDSPTYKDHAPNESVIVPLENPPGVQNLVLTFGMEKAANDWWWALDNIAVGIPPFAVGVTNNGVAFGVRILEALGKSVDTTKPVTLELDGAAVTATAAGKEGDFYTVEYSKAPQVFQPKTVHTVKIKFTSNENKAMEDTFSFIAPSYTTASATPVTVTAVISDAAWLTVDESKPVTVKLDGQTISGATVTRAVDATTVVVRFSRATPFEPGSSHSVEVTFSTTDGAQVIDSAAFIAPQIAVIPTSLATAVGTGAQPGLKWRTHQQEAGRAASIALAEAQLAPGSTIPSIHDTTGQGTDGFFLIDYVNFEQTGGEAGNFKASGEGSLQVEDGFIPGIPGTLGGNDNVAAEALSYVEFTQTGIYTMVVNSDDGFEVSVGTPSNAKFTILGAWDGGRGATDSQFYFRVDQAGVYFFRLLYFEGSGGSSVEWFTVNADGSRALVNGAQTGALKAYRVRTVAEPVPPVPAVSNRIFSEDFEGLTLGPKVDEGLAGSAVWTEMGPAGWVLDDSKMPGVGIPTQDGVTEWSGWSFANKNWWAQTAGGQQREQFSLGSGTVMIADNDEWDDAAHAQGFWDATIKTKSISLAGVPANSLVLFYDSSWRPEATDDGLPNFPVDAEGNRINDQTGYIWAQFDANTNEVQRWTSIGDSPTYKDHAPNESVIVPLENPPGVQNLVLTFGMEKAANDWWWALDNIAVGIPPFAVGVTNNGVAFGVRILEALGKSVDTTKPVTLELDGASVTPTEKLKEGDFYVVAYSKAPQVFQPKTVHTVKATYTSNGGTLLADSFSFIAPSYTTVSATPTTVTAVISDAAWLTVDESKPVTVKLDGQTISGATVTRAVDATSVVVRFTRATPFESGSSHTVEVTFSTTDGAQVVDSASFIAPQIAVVPTSLATAVGTGAQPGLKWRTHQQEAGRAASIALAEAQLAPGSTIPSIHDTTSQGTDGFFLIDYVNFEQTGGEAGNFKASGEGELQVEDMFIPGIPGTLGGNDNVAAEALAFVEIPAAGIYTMVVNSDDGFEVSVGTTNNAKQTILGQWDGGRGATDSQIYFRVDQAGVYYFRLLYFEGSGGSSVEWFTVNADGTRALVNGAQTGALKAYRVRTVAEPGGTPNNISKIARQGNSVVITYTGTLRSSTTVSGPFNPVAGASSPATVPITAGNQFFIAQ